METCHASPSRCRTERAPGRGLTGCAFRGAKRALQPIVDAAHLVHGVTSCESGSWESRSTASSGSLRHRSSFSTDLTEKDATLGAEKKLSRAIDALIDSCDPPAMFVYQTCLPAMIGDDIVGVCERAGQQHGRPVIPVDVPGFSGSRPYGSHRGAQILIKRVIGTHEPDASTPTDINLIGEFNVAAELDQIRSLLAELGIRVLASISGDGRFHDIATAHRARVSLQICSQGLGSLGQMLSREFGVPFIEGSFYGVDNIAETLRSLACVLVEQGAPNALLTRTEALIGREQQRIAEPLRLYRRRLAGKRVMLLSNGVKTWSIARMLRDAGMHIVGTGVNSASDADRRRVNEKAGHDTPMLNGWQPEEMDALLRAGGTDIVLGGGNSRFLALKAGIPWLEVNHERSLPLTGYAGTLALLDAIDRSLSNPIWQQVHSPAPWDNPSIEDYSGRPNIFRYDFPLT